MAAWVPAGLADRIGAAAYGSAAALVVAAFSARIVRRRAVAIATGAAAALCPTEALVGTGAWTAPLFVLLLLSAGYFLLAATDRPSSNLAVAAGALLALGAAGQSALPVLALAPLTLAPLWDRRYPRRAGVHIAMSALLGFGATFAPLALGGAVRLRASSGHPRPDIAAAAALVGVLVVPAAIGLLRAGRPGVRAFCLVFFGITAAVAALEPDCPLPAAAGFVLLIHAAFGVSTVVAPRDRAAAQSVS